MEERVGRCIEWTREVVGDERPERRLGIAGIGKIKQVERRRHLGME